MRAMRSTTGGKFHAVPDNAHKIGIYLLARCGARCIAGALDWPPETDGCRKCEMLLAKGGPS